jgi:nondiscriminating aspartyl-tRNA synthetase
VYRAEPHATSRHLTEYYSLDLEMGFIDGPEDVIQLERELLTHIFDRLNAELGSLLSRYRRGPLPSMMTVPIWTFRECLERLERPDLVDDLDPDAERQLCQLAEREHGVAAVFVLGFPLSARHVVEPVMSQVPPELHNVTTVKDSTSRTIVSDTWE